MEKRSRRKSGKGFPDKQHVIAYFDQKGSSDGEAEMFYQFHSEIQWLKKSGTKINWKTAANNWIWEGQQEQAERLKAFKRRIAQIQSWTGFNDKYLSK